MFRGIISVPCGLQFLTELLVKTSRRRPKTRQIVRFMRISRNNLGIFPLAYYVMGRERQLIP